MIAVREFTNTADMQAHAAAVRARCFSPKIKAVQKVPAPVVFIQPRPEPTVLVRPEWKCHDIYFDAHVIESRRILEMLAAGDIELVNVARRTVSQIVGDVLKEHPQFTISDIKSARRTRKLCHARMLAIFEVRMQRPDMSFPAIGRWFGGRDHTTILHSVRKIKAMRAGA